MNRVFGIVLLFVFSCSENKIHPPVGENISEEKNFAQRAKQLNETERKQILQWIENENTQFFPMGLNYWTDLEQLNQREKRKDGEAVSYQYEIYDFDKVKLYPKPKIVQGVYFGKFEEIKAVEDALRYMKKNEETTLLIPSVLAFGTYGDNDKISNDMPIIIKLKMID